MNPAHTSELQSIRARKPRPSRRKRVHADIYDPRGYVRLYRPDHPRANKSGRVYRHRLIAEKKLGRYLEPLEDVHHVNEVKGDDREENLCVLPRSVHKAIQGTQYGVNMN